MLEQIFRNINDIRIFDLMSDFVEEETENFGVLDIDEIMDMLDYNEYKRIEVEDSIKHLIENKILGIKKIQMEGITGCRTCRWTDKLKLPRVGEHKTHKPMEVNIGEIDKYYMIKNDLTDSLMTVIYAHITLTLEEYIEKKDHIEKKD